MGRIISSARTNWYPSALAPAGVLVTLLVCASPACGELNIVLNFLSAETDYPTFDDTGAGLIAMFEEAESRYEAIIKDTHTLWVNYQYKDLTDNTIGLHDPTTAAGNPERETVCTITIDTLVGTGGAEHDWFIDPSPDDDGEFAMERVLYRDLSPTEKTVYFDGSPPEVFEAAYVGTATDPDAQGRLDMLSVVLHEIGHGLGFTGWPAAVAETEDGDYDVPPALVGGAVMAVDHAPPDNNYHLAGAGTLMFPSLNAGERTLPSHADLFSMAAVQQYTYLDLVNREYLGGVILNESGNWMGGYPPNQTTNGYLRPNGGPPPYALTDADIAFRNLSLLEGSIVTANHLIDVFETTTIDGSGSAGTSYLRIQPAGTLQTNDLTAGGNGALKLIGGSADVFGEAFVELGGRIEGYGTLIVTDRLTNNGLITADGGVLALGTFSPDTVEVWDLDGGGGGKVEAIDGDVFVHGSHFGEFDGLMTVGPGRRIEMDRQWTLGKYGELQLNGAAGNPAEFSGADTVIHAWVKVDGEAVISGPLRLVKLLGSANAILRAFDVSAKATLTGPVTFAGGSCDGHGTIEQAGDFIVEADSTVYVHNFDWGNSDLGQRNDTLVLGRTFTINSATTGTPDNEYRGIITVQNGTLAVNTDDPWTLPVAFPGGDHDPPLPEGTLILETRGGGPPPTVEGQQLTVGGTVRAIGGLGVVDAPFVTTPTATVSAFTGAEIELRQATTWNGGTISGGGGIRQIGDARAVGSTAIATTYYDWDGDDATPSQTTIDPNVTLQINTQSIENAGFNTFDGVVNVNGGWLTINVPYPGSWTLGPSGVLNLTRVGGPAIVTGSPMAVSGEITTTGYNSIHSPVRFRESANVVATAWNDILDLRGHTDYEGGSYTGSGGIIQLADAFVNAPTTIDLGFFDMDGSPDANGDENTFVELHSDLALNVDRIDTGDNRFDGELEITDPAKLTVNTPTPWTMAGSMHVAGPAGTQVAVAGAEVVLEADVHIEPKNLLRFHADVSGPGNFTGGGDYEILGNYDPGSSPAVVTSAGNVSFADSARLILDIAGTDVVPVPQYDRLVVAGDVALDGKVVFRFTDGFVPQTADTFDVIVAVGAGSSMLGDGDIVIENLASGFLYDAGFEAVSGLNVFRLTALSDAVLASSVSSRRVFYNNSAFDVTQDELAVATDKVALQPGDPQATFDNYTSYSRGINGIIIEMDYLPDGVTPDSGDFEFTVGNDDTPGDWDDAPLPEILFDEGQGYTDQVTLIWEDYHIRNTWLEVTVLAAGLGMDENDVFYFGNAVGEACHSGADAEVNETDVLLAQDNPQNFFNPAGVTCPYDYNRDGRVNATDMLISRSNPTDASTALSLITVPEIEGTGQLAAVPEPCTLLLLSMGVLGLLAYGFCRRRRC